LQSRAQFFDPRRNVGDLEQPPDLGALVKAIKSIRSATISSISAATLSSSACDAYA